MTLFDGYSKYLSVVNPITQSTINTTLKDMDPALDALMRFINNVISINMGNRWDTVVTQLGLTNLVGKVVAQVEPIDPLPFATDTSYQFPLLAIYRKKESYDKRTTVWFSTQIEFELLYILPALTSAQYRQLSPFLTNIARVINHNIGIGLNSFYLDGQQVFRDINVDKLGVSNTIYGKIPGLQHDDNSNLWQPSLSITLQLWERTMPVDIEGIQYPSLTGIDGYVQNQPVETDEPIDIADFHNNFE